MLRAYGPTEEELQNDGAYNWGNFKAIEFVNTILPLTKLSVKARLYMGYSTKGSEIFLETHEVFYSLFYTTYFTVSSGKS